MEAITQAFTRIWLKTSTATLASSLAAASIAAGLLLYSLSSNNVIDESEEPYLSDEETLNIMRAFLDKLTMSGQKLNDHADQFRKQAAAQGQQIDEEQLLKAFLFPNFESILIELDSHMLQEHDLDECELKHAVNYYINQGNHKLKQICKKLNQVYKDFGGELDEEDESNFSQSISSRETVKSVMSVSTSGNGLTKEKFLQVLEELTKAVAEHANEFLLHFKSTYGTTVEAENLLVFQQGFMQVQEGATAKAFTATGISESDFHSAIEKYHIHTDVQQAMVQMQEIVPQVMAMHGFGLQQ